LIIICIKYIDPYTTTYRVILVITDSCKKIYYELCSLEIRYNLILEFWLFIIINISIHNRNGKYEIVHSTGSKGGNI